MEGKGRERSCEPQYACEPRSQTMRHPRWSGPSPVCHLPPQSRPLVSLALHSARFSPTRHSQGADGTHGRLLPSLRTRSSSLSSYDPQTRCKSVSQGNSMILTKNSYCLAFTIPGITYRPDGSNLLVQVPVHPRLVPTGGCGCYPP